MTIVAIEKVYFYYEFLSKYDLNPHVYVLGVHLKPSPLEEYLKMTKIKKKCWKTHKAAFWVKIVSPLLLPVPWGYSLKKIKWKEVPSDNSFEKSFWCLCFGVSWKSAHPFSKYWKNFFLFYESHPSTLKSLMGCYLYEDELNHKNNNIAMN